MSNTEHYSLVTKNTSRPQRTEVCLHYNTLPHIPVLCQPAIPTLFFNVYGPAAWLHLFLWAEMKASGSDVYIQLRGRPLRAGPDKTTRPSSLLFFLQPSIHPFIFFLISSNPLVFPSPPWGQFSSLNMVYGCTRAITSEQRFSTRPTSDW